MVDLTAPRLEATYKRPWALDKYKSLHLEDHKKVGTDGKEGAFERDLFCIRVFDDLTNTALFSFSRENCVEHHGH
jgi:hypothetical protein